MSDAESQSLVELRSAIEQLYAVFDRYPAPHTLEMSPLENRLRFAGLLSSTPLRELVDDELGLYADSALWTVGDADNYRHFLPRIFEIAVAGAPHRFGFAPEVIAAKLGYAKWRSWPFVEQQAIENVVRAAWRRSLGWHVDTADPIPWLEAIAALGMSTSQALDAWEKDPSAKALLQCARFAIESMPKIAKGKTVIDAMVTEWLQSKKLAETLFAAAVELPLTNDEREQLAWASDLIRNFA